MRTLVSRLSLVVCITLCIQQLHAQSLPAAEYGAGPVYAQANWTGSGSLSGTNFTGSQELPVTGPGVYAPSVNGGVSAASATLTVSPGPDPYLSLSASATSMPTNTTFNGNYADAGANPGAATFTYSLEVLGPSGSVPIQTNAALSAGLSAIPPACTFSLSGPCSPGSGPNVSGATPSSLASLTVAGDQEVPIYDYVTVGPYGGTTQNVYGGPTSPVGNSSSWMTGLSASLTDTRVWMAQTNTVYTVTLEVSTVDYLDGFYGAGTISGAAMVDPTFQLATGVSNPSEYSIVLSDGVGNTSPVPLPATAWLLLSGIGGIGAIARRRQSPVGTTDAAIVATTASHLRKADVHVR